MVILVVELWWHHSFSGAIEFNDSLAILIISMLKNDNSLFISSDYAGKNNRKHNM